MHGLCVAVFTPYERGGGLCPLFWEWVAANTVFEWVIVNKSLRHHTNAHACRDTTEHGMVGVNLDDGGRALAVLQPLGQAVTISAFMIKPQHSWLG